MPEAASLRHGSPPFLISVQRTIGASANLVDFTHPRFIYLSAISRGVEEALRESRYKQVVSSEAGRVAPLIAWPNRDILCRARRFPWFPRTTCRRHAFMSR